MMKQLLLGLAVFPTLVFIVLVIKWARIDKSAVLVPEPVGLACYVNTNPVGNPPDTVWTCFRPRTQ